MKRFLPFNVIGLFSLLLLALMGSHSGTAYAQDAPTPTSTYNPLAEPFLPENPSEYELGRNWYWHNCMTCHGDMGQGLTDEFRAIWPEDHQNCWGRGCHGGRRDDEGFPIPTFVPPLVTKAKLAQFSSQRAFYEFLKSAHPPQDPGCLEDEQYQAIVKYVFSMNGRPLEKTTFVPATAPAFAPTPTPEAASGEDNPSKSDMVIYVGLGMMLIFAILWGIRDRLPRP